MIAFFKAIESPSTMPLVEIQDVSWGSAKLTRKDGPVKIFGPRAVQVTELTCADFAAAGSVAQRGVMAVPEQVRGQLDPVVFEERIKMQILQDIYDRKVDLHAYELDYRGHLERTQNLGGRSAGEDQTPPRP